MDWSDEENMPRSHAREKFRPERSLERERYGEEYERYDCRKRGRRSPTPPEERRYKRRPSYSPPPMRHQGRVRDYKNDPDTDHYIPNYERDGYNPGPRYGGRPEPRTSSISNNGPPYPMMDMIPNQPWGGGRFPLVDPAQLDYLVPLKQFSDYTKRTAGRRIDEEEIQKRYALYKEKFLSRQLAQFFDANKEKEWFQEKYHPIISRPRQDDVKERRRRYLNEFLEALQKGDYDQVRYDKNAQSTTTIGEDEDEPENTTTEASEEDGNAEYESYLVIKTVPPTIAREKIIEMCKKVEGFDYLALSEPSPNKKFHRIGWINFKKGTDIKKKFEELDNQKVDDFVFHLALNRKNMSQSRVPRIAPDITNTTERLQKDLEQSKELATAFEAILGEDNVEGLKVVEARVQMLCDKHTTDVNDELEEKNIERWKLKKNLDLIITYLRHVHMYCYYCGVESDSLQELSRKCFDPHCRTISASSMNERGVAQWAKNLDRRISLKIHTPDESELEKLGGRILQTEIEEFIKEHVLKEHESKFKCQVGGCSKAFKGFDYVEKHILAKHPEEIDRIKTEVEYYNNYICDPNHLTPNNSNSMNNNPMNPSMMPMASFPQPFMMGAPHFPAAIAGTPWDQIPRVGFDSSGYSRRPRPTSAYMDLESSLPKDPRQVTSYVDLDAPAEGDSNISFY